MKDTVITIIAIFLAGILIFVFPLLVVAERNNDIAQSVVKTATAEFVNNAATTGVITLAQYEKFLNKIQTTSNKYDIDMQVEKIDSNVGKKTQWVSNDVIGENQTYSIYTIQIVKGLKETGSFNLQKGDTFSVKVKNTSPTFANMLRGFLGGADKGYAEIQAQDSALVTATGSR